LLAHLATADATAAPHVVPVCFAVHGEQLYIALDEKAKQVTDLLRLRRVRNIVENPRVAVVADVFDERDWSRLGFVLVRGRARVLSADAGSMQEERGRALVALRAKYEQYRGMALEERPLIAIHVERVTRWGRIDDA
jgi:PPOX class probable F420-dependent enzyme